MELPDTDPDEPQGRETYGGRHLTHLAVAPLPKFEGDPRGGNILAVPDGRLPWGQGRMDFLGGGRKGCPALDDHARA